MIAGPCSDEEECSAPNNFPQGSTNAANLYAQDSTVGVCVKPKAGGAACTAGAGKLKDDLWTKSTAAAVGDVLIMQ